MDGGGVKFFQLLSFFLSFIGDYVFQRDLPHAATRPDHQAPEKAQGRNGRRGDADTGGTGGQNSGRGNERGGERGEDDGNKQEIRAINSG